MHANDSQNNSVLHKFAAWVVTLGLVLLCALAVFGAWFTTIHGAHIRDIGSSYPFSAYLVDYSTGFIRRGAIGAVVGLFLHGQSRLLLISWLLFINYVVLMICVAVLILLNAERKLATALLVLLLPSGIVMAGIMDGFFVWKEALFLAALGLLDCGYNIAVRLPVGSAQRAMGRVYRGPLGCASGRCLSGGRRLRVAVFEASALSRDSGGVRVTLPHFAAHREIFRITLA